MRRSILYSLSAILLLLLLGYLATGVYEVRPGERAVVRRFGRVLEHKPEPGLWVGLPWGMDRVDRVPVDLVRRVEVGYRPEEDATSLTTPPGQMLTGDHNLVNVRVVVNYTVDPHHVEDYVIQADRVDSLVSRAVEAALAEWAAGRYVDDILINGKTLLPRWLVREVQTRLEPYRLGIRIADASVAWLLPPDEVKPAFDEVNRAQTEIRTRIYEAEQEAENRLRRAEAEKYRTEQLAAAYVREQRLLAEAEAASFTQRLEQYRRLRERNPDILTAIWYDEMTRLLTRLKAGGQIDLLDHHLGRDGLDITTVQPPPKR
jgi:membrane protease subunit HflK